MPSNPEKIQITPVNLVVTLRTQIHSNIVQMVGGVDVC